MHMYVCVSLSSLRPSHIRSYMSAKRHSVPDGRKAELGLYLEHCKSNANIDFHLQFHIATKLLKVDKLQPFICMRT